MAVICKRMGQVSTSSAIARSLRSSHRGSSMKVEGSTPASMSSWKKPRSSTSISDSSGSGSSSTSGNPTFPSVVASSLGEVRGAATSASSPPVSTSSLGKGAGTGSDDGSGGALEGGKGTVSTSLAVSCGGVDSSTAAG